MHSHTLRRHFRRFLCTSNREIRCMMCADLVTIATRPLALAGGDLQAAGELKAGDRIFRWDASAGPRRCGPCRSPGARSKCSTSFWRTLRSSSPTVSSPAASRRRPRPCRSESPRTFSPYARGSRRYVAARRHEPATADSWDFPKSRSPKAYGGRCCGRPARAWLKSCRPRGRSWPATFQLKPSVPFGFATRNMIDGHTAHTLGPGRLCPQKKLPATFSDNLNVWQ